LPLQLTIAQSGGFYYGFSINDNFGKLVPYQNLPMQGDNTTTYTIAVISGVFILGVTINLYIHKSIKGINTAIKVVFPELSDEPFNFSMNNMASTGLQATYTTNAAEFFNYLKSNVGRTVPLLFSFYKI
jgi:hypothetical protein